MGERRTRRFEALLTNEEAKLAWEAITNIQDGAFVVELPGTDKDRAELKAAIANAERGPWQAFPRESALDPLGVQVQRLRPQTGDVLVCRSLANTSDSIHDGAVKMMLLRRQLWDKNGIHCSFVVTAPGDSLEIADEAAMERAGWVRKERVLATCEAIGRDGLAEAKALLDGFGVSPLWGLFADWQRYKEASKAMGLNTCSPSEPPPCGIENATISVGPDWVATGPVYTAQWHDASTIPDTNCPQCGAAPGEYHLAPCDPRPGFVRIDGLDVPAGTLGRVVDDTEPNLPPGESGLLKEAQPDAPAIKFREFL